MSIKTFFSVIKSGCTRIAQTSLVVKGKEYFVQNGWKKRGIFILLYPVFLHFVECLVFFVRGMNSSFGNPFIQGLWGWLALLGIGLIPGGVLSKILLSVLILLQSLVTMISIFLAWIFALPLRADSIAVLNVSSPSEIRDFLQMFVSWKVVLGVFLATVLLFVILRTLWKTEIKRSIYLYLLIAVLLLPQGINVLRFIRMKSYEDIYQKNSISRFVAEVLTYHDNIRFLTKMEATPQIPDGICCNIHDKNFTAVLVIGESATRFHHSIYGYPRETSPLLGGIKEKLFLFTDVISGYAHTVQSLSYMLTTEDKQHPGDYRYTLFDIFRQAGFKIYFASNQSRWGEYDSPIALMTCHADSRIYFQEKKAGALDDILLPYFKEISQYQGKKLIVLHLSGNHDPFYNKYPKSFAFFHSGNRITSPYAVDDWEMVDEYDNSLRFTDSVLRAVIDELAKKPSPAFMLYCSDHGMFPEQVYSSPRSGASTSPEHYEIPFIFYANEAFLKRSSGLVDQLKQNLDKPFVTDHLMFPLFSASGITFEGFPYQSDLFSSRFIPTETRNMGTSSIMYNSRTNPYCQIPQTDGRKR